MIFLKRTAFVSGETIRGSLAYSKSHARDCVETKPLMIVFHGRQVEYQGEKFIPRTIPLLRIGVPLWRIDQQNHDISRHLDSIKPPTLAGQQAAAAGGAGAPSVSGGSPTRAKSIDMGNKIRFDPGTYIFDFEINLPALMHPSFIVRTGTQVHSQLVYELSVFRPENPIDPLTNIRVRRRHRSGSLRLLTADFPDFYSPSRTPLGDPHAPCRVSGKCL